MARADRVPLLKVGSELAGSVLLERLKLLDLDLRAGRRAEVGMGECRGGADEAPAHASEWQSV